MATSCILTEIAGERRLEIETEGRIPERDNVHRNGELAGAAACYIMHGLKIHNAHLNGAVRDMVGNLWPWAAYYWTPFDRRRDLVRAAALIVAEIERLDRTAEPTEGT